MISLVVPASFFVFYVPRRCSSLYSVSRSTGATRSRDATNRGNATEHPRTSWQPAAVAIPDRVFSERGQGAVATRNCPENGIGFPMQEKTALEWVRRRAK
jgi:hypothetical protein